MMTTNSVSSALKMFGRLTVALLISLAPLKVGAANPGSADLAGQASRLGARAMTEEDPEAAAVVALEAKNLWIRAFQADGAEHHLCKARSLLAALAARSELDEELRTSIEQSRDALPRCPKPGRSQRLQQRLKRIHPTERLPDLVDVPPPVAQAATPGVDLPPRLVQAQALEQPERSGHGFQVGGGISMALGLLALGVMTPFAVRDAATAREIDSLIAKREAAGGLTREEDQRAAELADESRLTVRSSLALGLTGAIATVLGASLLIIGHRRSITFAPRADLNSASISLQGRF